MPIITMPHCCFCSRGMRAVMVKIHVIQVNAVIWVYVGGCGGVDRGCGTLTDLAHPRVVVMMMMMLVLLIDCGFRCPCRCGCWKK